MIDGIQSAPSMMLVTGFSLTGLSTSSGVSAISLITLLARSLICFSVRPDSCPAAAPAPVKTAPSASLRAATACPTAPSAPQRRRLRLSPDRRRQQASRFPATSCVLAKASPAKIEAGLLPKATSVCFTNRRLLSKSTQWNYMQAGKFFDTRKKSLAKFGTTSGARFS